jgi:phytoene/squalene synthetase
LAYYYIAERILYLDKKFEVTSLYAFIENGDDVGDNVGTQSIKQN